MHVWLALLMFWQAFNVQLYWYIAIIIYFMKFSPNFPKGKLSLCCLDCFLPSTIVPLTAPLHGNYMNADSAGYLLGASRSYKLVDTWLWQVAVLAKTFITRAVSLQNVTMVYCYRRLFKHLHKHEVTVHWQSCSAWIRQRELSGHGDLTHTSVI